MNYAKIIKGIISIIKRRRSSKYIRIITKKERAEVTIETAIVFTIIMILICSMIYLSLFLHDKVAIKSYTYSGLVEGADKDKSKCNEIVQAKVRKTPTFVIRPSASFDGDINKYQCHVSEKEQSTMRFLDKVMTFAVGKQEVEVVRKMPIDKMYLYKAIKDGIKK